MRIADTTARRLAFRDATLEQRLKTLMAVRLVMVTTLLLVAVYVEAVSEYLLPVNPFYFVIAATYALTVLHAVALRVVRSGAALVYSQVVGDLLTVTALVYLTGGSRTGFTLLYPPAVLTGSVLLYRGGGMYLAAVATSFYAGILGAVRLGKVPPQGLSDVLFLPTGGIVYSVIVTGVACASVALIGSYFSATLHHVGERLEQATGEVADLRQLNDLIVGSIHSGLLMVDQRWRILYVNERGEAILGRRASELRGRTLAESLGWGQLEEGRTRAGGSLKRLDLNYERPDGRPLELGVSVTPLATAEPGQLLVFQDLTEVKQLEREVRAKEKLAAVGEMAAQLAHEIRNPLGSISGSAQVLLGEPNISPEQSRLLEIIRRESKRLSDSLNGFLYQTRVTPPPSHPVDLAAVIGEAVTLLRNASELRANHVVDFELGPGPHLCLADRDKIAQVFWNLARNGLEAMPEGGRLSIRLTRRGDEVVLRVRDQGRGLAGQDEGKVFEPFRSGTSMGSGLGLAIVYRIVREHRGDIAVRSAPVQGTEFEVHLPAVAAPVPA